MDKLFDKEKQEKLIKEVDSKERDLIAVLERTGGLKFLFDQLDTDEDREMANKQVQAMAKQLQPAVDFVYEALKVPGAAEELYEKLLPNLKETKKQHARNVKKHKKQEDNE